MITDHPFNLDLSHEVYQACKDIVFPKECYSNIYYVVDRYYNKFRSKEWKVAYGYFRILPDHNMWARHAFIVNKQGEAIDPTVCSHENGINGENEEYKSFHVFKNVMVYGMSIKHNQNVPDLITPLHKAEAKMVEWAGAKEMILIGGL